MNRTESNRNYGYFLKRFGSRFGSVLAKRFTVRFNDANRFEPFYIKKEEEEEEEGNDTFPMHKLSFFVPLNRFNMFDEKSSCI